MTRSQVPALNALVGAVETSGQVSPTDGTSPAAAAIEPALSDQISGKHPVIPSGIDEFYLPNNLTLKQSISVQNLNITDQAGIERINYHPALLSQCEVRYQNAKYDLQLMTQKTALVEDDDGRLIRWDDFQSTPLERQSLGQTELPQSTFKAIPGWLSDPKNLKSLQNDFTDWVYRNASVIVRANESLKIYGSPEISSVDFRKQCSDAARDQLNKELEDLKYKFDKKLDRLKINSKKKSVM